MARALLPATVPIRAKSKSKARPTWTRAGRNSTASKRRSLSRRRARGRRRDNDRRFDAVEFRPALVQVGLALLFDFALIGTVAGRSALAIPAVELHDGEHVVTRHLA